MIIYLFIYVLKIKILVRYMMFEDDNLDIDNEFPDEEELTNVFTVIKRKKNIYTPCDCSDQCPCLDHCSYCNTHFWEYCPIHGYDTAEEHFDNCDCLQSMHPLRDATIVIQNWWREVTNSPFSRIGKQRLISQCV